MTLLDSLKENPLPFFLCFLCVAAGVVAGFVGIFVRSRRGFVLGGLAVASGVACLGAGALGYTTSSHLGELAASDPRLNARERARIVDVSSEGARNALFFGIGSGLLPLGLGVAALLRARGRRASLHAG